MEAALPGTPSFDVSEKAAEDIREGLTARIAKMIGDPAGMLFMERLNELDLLDAYLDDPDSADSDAQRESFAGYMTAGGCAALREILPELMDRAKDSGRAYCSAVSEMLLRLDGSHDGVCDTLLGGRRFSILTDVDADCGDVHDGGRAVCVLTTDAGRLVYKPHDVMIDLYTKGLIDRFFHDIMRAPAVLACEGYGFAEFVENRPADTDEEARRYFYSLGGLAAVVQMLGSNDLHHNNVFALGRYPVIIDSELMLTPGRAGTEGGLAEDLRNSLYFSSLMPARSVNSEMSILFAGDGASPSAPVVDGRVRNIKDYPGEFFEGFRNTYERIMDRRPEIREYIRSMKGASVRHILRGTSVYGELVKRMLEPARLRDGSARDELMKALLRGPARSGMPAPEAIAEAEADAIMSARIPYFYMRSDGCGLWSGGREVCPDFMPQSPLDNALARLEHMSPEDLRFEESLIRKAMGRVMTRSARDDEPDVPVNEDMSVSCEQLIKHAERIFDDIMRDALETPGGHLCWFGTDNYLTTGMEALGAGLHSGSLGIAVFAAALSALSADEDMRRRAEDLSERMTAGLRERAGFLEGLDHLYPNTCDLSLAGGLAGRLLGCRLIQQYTGDDSLDELCGRIVKLIGRAEPDYAKTDVYGGIAGIIRVLTRSDDIFAMPGAAEAAERFADRLKDSASISWRGRYIWKTGAESCALSGTGHGQSGIASALYTAGERLGRDDLKEAAMAGFIFERDTYSGSMNAWPDRRRGPASQSHLAGYCSGAPGIGLDALRTGYEGSDGILEKAVKSCLAEPLQYKDFLCCGNSAVSDFLLEAGTALGDGSLVRAAEARMAAVIERAERNGAYTTVNRGVARVFSPGLMYGTAGIGYVMLRLASPGRIHSLL